MSRRTPAPMFARPRPRSTARRDAFVAVAVLVGASAALTAAATDEGPREIRSAAASSISPAARSIPGVEPAAPDVAAATAGPGSLASDPGGLAAAREQAAADAAAQLAAEQEAARVAEEQAAADAAAARAAVWDRLADCESGHWDREKRPVPGTARWDYGLHPSEDGFFQGGLQFHPVTWDEFRDPDMPDHAGNATRSQQIAIAERVLAKQGWGAWPVCSRKLGYR